MLSFISGFFLGFSLILAIGAQNAYVLKCGINKKYIFIVCLICALSDAVLIVLGVTGFSIITESYNWIISIVLNAGIVFLLLYGVRSFWLAFNKQDVLGVAPESNDSLLQVVVTCLAFTWLNPHVYLDTLVLVGSVSVQHGENLVQFTLGAILSSFVFFYSLGYAARLLTPFFNKPLSWKILDFMIGTTMFAIAYTLI
jgi:L-lysine exporter family protein LysE/ArgO